ncbi:related to GTPase-activating protein of the rho/rac family (LRG1 protein) [Fusarium mangiferae]|uniref:Related to GTPase-activating protein of the rho/rac family (LRG1 protein) n=1 Tax=Fusarium mangiferae TaxID=192010 RepID=A0A1L7SNS3_FUSMA|nr:uncharacterized protein FMAN_01772 [Fusarium mangiferae]CVK84846.1 related to GTPase-activating protein of the rho/rac family (LRG1 protein) [Fusarium mangiferae]
MDPLSIASSVVGLTATCLATCKKLHDLAGEFQDVPAIIAMICSESTIISIGLSELQTKILQRDDLAQAWASKTEIWMVFEAALTGCMIVFSCLEAETRSLRSENPGLWAKIKFIWNQDRLRELLGALRGQQSSINFLLNLLELETLSNIQKDIRTNAPRIKAAASQAQSLRSCNPSVKMDIESVFDNDAAKLSYFDVETVSGIAPSELDFTFDDVVINSQAYRRVFIKARSEIQQLHVGNVDSDTEITKTKKEGSVDSQKDDVSSIRKSREWASSYTTDTGRSQLRGKNSVSRLNRKISWQGTWDISLPSELSSTCSACSKRVTGRQVTALGQKWHAKCFTCSDCGVTLQSDCFLSQEENGIQPKPLCEQDFLRRRDIHCFKCQETIIGDFIGAFDRQYHKHHFTCDKCEIIFTKKSDWHQQDGGIYCMLHFCRDIAYYCDGCKFPIMEGCHVSDQQGRTWHSPCFRLSSSWGLILPVSSNGRRYLDFIRDKSQTRLSSFCQQLHDVRTNDIYLCCSNFTTGFRNSVAYSLHLCRQKPREESYESWRVVLSMLARLFRATTKAINNGGRNSELMYFTSTLQGRVKDYIEGREPSAQVVGLQVSELLKPLLKLSFQGCLQDHYNSWDVGNEDLDEIINCLGAVGLDELDDRYDQQPTGPAEESWTSADNFQCITQHRAFEHPHPGRKLLMHCCSDFSCQKNCQADGTDECKVNRLGEGLDVTPCDKLALNRIWRCWYDSSGEESQE